MTRPARPPRRSAAAARRLVQQNTSRAEGPVRPDVAAAVAAYRPHTLDQRTWTLVEPVVGRTLHGSTVTGPESLRKHITHLALFYGWAHHQGLPLEVATLTRPHIDAYISTGMPQSSAKSRSDRRARLRRIADRLHPDQAVRGAAIARPAVKPPYTSAEMATIARTALEQSEPTRRRLCLCVGLGAGAGLASTDLRHLRRGDIDDRGAAGLYVTVRSPRARTVPVLTSYELHVRVGLHGLAADDLVLGMPVDARNLAARAVDDAVLLDDCPHIEQSRLRHTWLAVMLSSRVPLRTLLAASGLQSAKTLTDLLEHLPPDDSAAEPTTDPAGVMTGPSRALALLRDPEVLA